MMPRRQAASSPAEMSVESLNFLHLVSVNSKSSCTYSAAHLAPEIHVHFFLVAKHWQQFMQ